MRPTLLALAESVHDKSEKLAPQNLLHKEIFMGGPFLGERERERERERGRGRGRESPLSYLPRMMVITKTMANAMGR